MAHIYCISAAKSCFLKKKKKKDVGKELIPLSQTHSIQQYTEQQYPFYTAGQSLSMKNFSFIFSVNGVQSQTHCQKTEMVKGDRVTIYSKMDCVWVQRYVGVHKPVCKNDSHVSFLHVQQTQVTFNWQQYADQP